MLDHQDHPLSDRAQQAIRDGEAAWARVSSDKWDDPGWWQIGTALTLLRQQTLHELGSNVARGSLYNTAFAAKLATTKFATMESVTRSNLLFLMEPEIRIVLDQLLASWKPDVRAKRTHPTTLAQYVRRELKPKPAPAAQPAAAPPSPAQKLVDLQAKLAEAQAEIERLKQAAAPSVGSIRVEPRLAPAGPAPLPHHELPGDIPYKDLDKLNHEKLKHEVFRVRLQRDGYISQLEKDRRAEPEVIADLRRSISMLLGERDRRDRAVAAAAKAKAKAKAEAVAVAAASDPVVAELNKKIKDLRRKNAEDKRDHQEASRLHGAMNSSAVRLISKALSNNPHHPPTDHDRDEAIRAFNAWKSDSSAARRRDR